MTSASDRRRKKRERRAASRRLPPVRTRGGRGLATGGRAGSVRMIGIGQFAQGLERRSEARRQQHGLRRVASAVVGVLAAIVIVLVIIARVAGHL